MSLLLVAGTALGMATLLSEQRSCTQTRSRAQDSYGTEDPCARWIAYLHETGQIGPEDLRELSRVLTDPNPDVMDTCDEELATALYQDRTRRQSLAMVDTRSGKKREI